MANFATLPVKVHKSAVSRSWILQIRYLGLYHDTDLHELFEAKNDNGCCSFTCHHTCAASGPHLDRGGCRPRRLERSVVGAGW